MVLNHYSRIVFTVIALALMNIAIGQLGPGMAAAQDDDCD